MFKKTRRRIFALIVGTATLLMVLMLSAIYAGNASRSYDRSLSLLQSYVDSTLGGPPSAPAQHPGKREEHHKMFTLSTFYSVLYSPSGEVVRVDCHGGELYTAQEIISLAQTVLAKGRRQGICGGMPYLVTDTPGGQMVALIDNTMEADAADRLFINTMATGLAAWLVLLVLAWVSAKKIVDPLEQNDIRQRQFISDAGHELKTPISVIGANAELLSRELGENRWLANIRYENERMGGLVQQLLQLARAENTPLTLQRLDFSRLVSGEVLPFESVAFENGLALTSDLEEGIAVMGSESQLRQLVAILVDNAIHHGAQGKEAAVRLCAAGHKAVLSVVNEGPPIPEEEREQLFHRFYRADAARTDDAGHFGLGLAIAKAIVTAHGGRLELSCHDGLVEFRAVLPRV